MHLKSYNYQGLINIQEQFNRRLLEDKGIDLGSLSEKELHYILKDLCLHIIDEIMEVLRELNWKMHKKFSKKIDRKAVIEELVDIDKFLKNFLVFLNVSEDEFVTEWNRKTKVVFDRYRKEMET